MSRVLFLDDDAERHLVADKRWPTSDHEVFHAWNVCQFERMLLKYGPFDLISLDHDLGDFRESNDGYVGGYGERTGLDAARFICIELPAEQRPATVIVHSWNPVGAERMLKLLQDYGIPCRQELFQYED